MFKINGKENRKDSKEKQVLYRKFKYLAEVINKKKQAIEVAQESLQKAQIRRAQVEAVRKAEDNSIREQMIQSEKEEIKRVETQRAIKHKNQNNMKQYLDIQKGIKLKEIYNQKAQDRAIAQEGLAKEERDYIKRNDYFIKLQKFQDLNDQKTKNLVKYMQADPKTLAEERDK